MKTIQTIITSIKTAYYKAFGQPVWVEFADGRVRETRVKTLSDGTVVIRGFMYEEWSIAPPPVSYDKESPIQRWWPK